MLTFMLIDKNNSLGIYISVFIYIKCFDNVLIYEEMFLILTQQTLFAKLYLSPVPGEHLWKYNFFFPYPLFTGRSAEKYSLVKGTRAMSKRCRASS